MIINNISGLGWNEVNQNCQGVLLLFPELIIFFILVTDVVFFLTVCYYHVTYGFQSESTLYSLPECQGTR